MPYPQDQHLLLAIQQRNQPVAIKAIEEGANVSIKGDADEPIICLAIDQGLNVVVRALLDAGVDPNAGAKDHEMTPLFVAAHAETPQAYEIAEMLLGAGADPNYTWPGDGTTVLSVLLESGAPPARILRMVRLLIDYDVDLEQPREDGFRPLLLAISHRLDRVVDVMLDAGADPKSWRVDHPEVTTWAVAEYTGNRPLMLRLERAGAKNRSPRIEHDMSNQWHLIATAFDKGGLPDLSRAIYSAMGTQHHFIGVIEEYLKADAPIPSDVKAQWFLFGDSKDLVIWDYALLDTEAVASLMQSRQQLQRDDPTWAAQPPHDLPYGDEHVQRVWWHLSWLPIARDRRGNLLCVDMSPATQGQRGQVFYWGIQEGPTHPVSPSWQAFITDYAQDVGAGTWRYDSGTGLFDRP